MVAREVFRGMRRMEERLRQRIAGVVSRAVVSTVNDSLRMQGVSLRLAAREVRDGAEHLQPYGLSAAIEDGYEGLAFSVGGDRDHIVMVCASARGDRPNGQDPGEVSLYSRHGQRIHLRADGSILATAAAGAKVEIGGDSGKPIAVNGDTVTISGALTTWVNAVTLATMVPALVGTTIGTVDASTTESEAT